MINELRWPFFIVAAIVLLIVIGLEASTSFIPVSFDSALMRAQTADSLKNSDLSDDDKSDITNQMVQQARSSAKPPGLAIPYKALLDGLLLYAVLLMVASKLWERVASRVQGLVTLIVSIVLMLAAIVLAIKACVEVMVMIGLFTSAPFGTIAYLAIWGFFPTGTASAMLGLSLVLTLVFTILLALANQRFLQIKSLVALIITSTVCCFVIGFLHSFVPGFLASITDRIAAIVVMIVLILWCIYLAIMAIISISKVII